VKKQRSTQRSRGDLLKKLSQKGQLKANRWGGDLRNEEHRSRYQKLSRVPRPPMAQSAAGQRELRRNRNNQINTGGLRRKEKITRNH